MYHRILYLEASTTFIRHSISCPICSMLVDETKTEVTGFGEIRIFTYCIGMIQDSHSTNQCAASRLYEVNASLHGTFTALNTASLKQTSFDSCCRKGLFRVFKT